MGARRAEDRVNVGAPRAEDRDESRPQCQSSERAKRRCRCQKENPGTELEENRCVEASHRRVSQAWGVGSRGTCASI